MDNLFGFGIKEDTFSLSPMVVGKKPVISQIGAGEDAKKLATAALSAVKEAPALAMMGRGKVEITEVRGFAGEEIEIKKLVTPSAVDAVLEQIRKKPKLSVLDKTKKDWGEYKDENRGVEEELDAYKKSSTY